MSKCKHPFEAVSFEHCFSTTPLPIHSIHPYGKSITITAVTHSGCFATIAVATVAAAHLSASVSPALALRYASSYMCTWSLRLPACVCVDMCFFHSFRSSKQTASVAALMSTSKDNQPNILSQTTHTQTQRQDGREKQEQLSSQSTSRFLDPFGHGRSRIAFISNARSRPLSSQLSSKYLL